LEAAAGQVGEPAGFEGEDRYAVVPPDLAEVRLVGIGGQVRADLFQILGAEEKRSNDEGRRRLIDPEPKAALRFGDCVKHLSHVAWWHASPSDLVFLRRERFG
jgi:hypothetical protein